jgi:hypothetical protein
MDKDINGKITLKVTLPAESIPDNMARSLTGMVNVKPEN